MTNKLRLAGGFAVVLLAGTTIGAIVLGGPTSSANQTNPAPVAAAVQRDFAPRILSTGRISLLPGARIEVGARVSGVVVSLPVTQGSRVERDAVIARLDDRAARANLIQANTAVAELEAALQQQEQDLTRVEALAKIDGTTARELMAARTSVLTAQARLEGAKAARALAQLQLDYTVIRAPISGTVASVSTQEGETVAASLAAPTFVTLLDPTRIECIALVDETDIGGVQVGDQAEFTVDAYPGRVFHGVVISIAPDATLVGGVVDYEVRVKITDDVRALKPQMTASVTISSPARHALVIPSAAVRQSPVGTFVWRRKAGAIERIAVVLGTRQSDFSEVRSGIAAGDTVLTGGFPETQNR
jgi:RND family efflux transporter MFP subunit